MLYLRLPQYHVNEKMPNSHMGRLNAHDNLTVISALCIATERTLTSELPKATHVTVREELGVFQARP